VTYDTDDERFATDLLRARDEARVATAPTERDPTFDLARGYRVGLTLHRQLVGRGYRPVGRKVGLTSPDAWRAFNLSTPIWAHVYDRTVRPADQGRCDLSLRGMVAPRIEPEVVLKLRTPLPPGELTADAVARCVEWAAIGFEVVDCHYPGWRFTGPDAVADFGVHAGLVVGTPWPVGSEDPGRVADLLAGLRVTLRGGDFAATGEGRNALGSPLLVLAHLAGVMATQPWAPPLSAGEVVTTGTLTPLPFVRPGETYRVEVEGAPLAALELAFGG
jgi:2-oxo-3-hexenedioate decarboxylase